MIGLFELKLLAWVIERLSKKTFGSKALHLIVNPFIRTVYMGEESRKTLCFTLFTPVRKVLHSQNLIISAS